MAMVSLAALAAARRSSSTSARSADAVPREAERAAWRDEGREAERLLFAVGETKILPLQSLLFTRGKY